MELEIKAPITVNTFDRTFVEQALSQMTAMFEEVRASQQALDAKFNALMADEATVQQLTEKARKTRTDLAAMGERLKGALEDGESDEAAGSDPTGG